MCTFRHPYAHPCTAAVNQIACSFAIKGSAFATIIYSISESHKNNIKEKIGILTIAKGIF